ncbi:cupin domain-containing protein [Henriciella sp.]|uniref:cupin domain-containing protein n=1 Tax=Henriciella sp. TaxID=1968823 RepID=UPI00262182EC|nr:cupin domain-containing protein [Henriciella sp.]
MTPSAQSEIFTQGLETLAEDLGNGIRRKLLGYDGNILMAKVWFAQGAVGEVHTHYHSQVTYVVSGQFEVQIDGQKKQLGEGDCFFVPPHAPHGAVCLEPGILLDVFSPAREDFLAYEGDAS